MMVDTAWLALALFGLFSAGVVKGATGLGYASCALPFLVPIVGLKTAIGLVVLPAIAANVQILLTAGHVRETVAQFHVLYLAMLPGIMLGLWALAIVDAHSATRTLGAVMALYACLALSAPQWRLPQRFEAPLQLPVGLLNGFLTGLTGSQVMPLFPYIMALGLEPARLVQAVNIAVTGATIVLGVGLLAMGIMTREIFGASLIAVLPALFGVAIGTRARAHIPAQRFRLIVISFVGMMGTALFVR